MQMSQIHIRNLDLNLLKVLDALLEEGGVGAAGRRLGLTQSAVSHALNRLRAQVGDPLFVRTPSGMRPTPRAIEMGGQVREALAQLTAALEPVRFDPVGSRRRFALAASGYICAVLLPDLLKRMKAAAPLAELKVVSAAHNPAEILDQGRVDLAIGAFGRAPDRYGREQLYEDDMVWVARAGHPAANGPLTLETLAGLSILQVASGDESHGDTLVDHGLERQVRIGGGEALRAALSERGLSLRAPVSVPDSQTALAVLVRTDFAALLPRRLVEPFRRALAIFEPPHPTSALQLSMLWRKDRDNPGAVWFRGLVGESAAAVR
jgi:DNA-binding transcriptional LysR family regulator